MTDWLPLKEAFMSSKLPREIEQFDITTIIDYYIKYKNDFRSIREESFQLFQAGHVQVITV